MTATRQFRTIASVLAVSTLVAAGAGSSLAASPGRHTTAASTPSAAHAAPVVGPSIEPVTGNARPVVSYGPPRLATGERQPSAAEPSYLSAPSNLPVDGRNASETWHRAGDRVTATLYAGAAYRHTPAGWVPLSTRITPQGDGLVADGLTRPITFGRTPGSLLTIGLADGSVAVSAPGAHVGTPRLVSGAVAYDGFAPQADLAYTVVGDGADERITLNGPSAPHSYVFHIADPAGRLGSARRMEDGSWRFDRPVDAVSQAELTIGAGRAFTPSDPGHPGSGVGLGDAAVVVARAGDGWDVTESVDGAWLSKQAYPVVLDPSMSFSGTSAARDCALYSGIYATSSYCNAQYLQVGSYMGGNPSVNHGYVQRDVLYFNTAAIPANALVTAASLNLQQYNATATTTTVSPEEVHALTRAFTQSATWNTYDGTNPWSAAGGDYNPTVAASTSTLPATSAGTAAWSPISGVVQQWVTSPTQNYGLELRQNAETVNNRYSFNATSGTGTPPSLTVTFTTPATAPGAVTAVPTSGGATVQWQPAQPTDPQDPISAYEVRVYATGTTSPVVASARVSCSVSGTTSTCPSSTVVRGLTNGTSYYAAVDAVDQAGAGPATNSANFTPTAAASWLGLESWWQFDTLRTGPMGSAAVNVANGNLVVQQTDSTPIQGHGGLGYQIRRTYNSLDAPLTTLPGSIGAGWILNLGGSTDGVASATPDGLYVDANDTPATPASVTLVDQDGTRHLFAPKNATGGRPQLSVATSAGPVAGALSFLAPRSLSLSAGSYTNVCVDTAYAAPAGVHLALFRYLEVDSTGGATACTTGPGRPAAVVMGFATVRPDRLRTEYSSDGHIVDQQDAAGNELRYLYDAQPVPGVAVGRLQAVFEPRACQTAAGTPTTASAIPSTCRAYRFAYASSATPPTTTITDPAGRPTVYTFDTQATGSTAHLMSVSNPDGSQLRYSYSQLSGAANCGPAGTLCSATDPRGTAASWTYGTGPSGLTAVAAATDRRGTATTYAYSGSSTTGLRNSSQSTNWSRIDSSGRVGEKQQSQGQTLYRDMTWTWDVAGATCRIPDATVDNDLCASSPVETTNAAGAAPTGSTVVTYSDEGMPLVAAVKNGQGGKDTTTASYHVQNVGVDGTDRTYDDTLVGNGTVTPSSPRTDSGALTLYTLDDGTASLTPRGNAAGSAFAPYETLVVPDDLSASAADTAGTAPYCNSGTATGNTGLVCERDTPASDPSPSSVDHQHDVTRYTYDPYGQMSTKVTPVALATAGAAAASYRYVYYQDTDLALSGTVSAGGWLKGVADLTASYASGGTDPQNKFDAYAYDAAGDVVRTWDRAATTRGGKPLSQYPGSLASPSTAEYAQTLYQSGSPASAIAAPWRYARSRTDPLGNSTSITVDPNGNATRTTPPRGMLSGGTGYDTVATFASDDLMLTSKAPTDSTATTNTYDPYGNLVSVTDPRGSVLVFVFDGVNRPVATRSTRDAYTSAAPSVSDCAPGTKTGAADSPLPAGRILCATATSYDGRDDALAVTDENGATSTFYYDVEGRPIEHLQPRTQNTSLRSDTVYDADGRTVTTCTPREFDPAEGNATTCPANPLYGTQTVWDPAGRLKSQSTVRAPSGTAEGSTGPRTVVASSYRYDADGNVTSDVDPAGHTSSYTFDPLDRQVTATSPRTSTTSTTTTTYYDPVGDVTGTDAPGDGTTDRYTAASFDADNRVIDTITGASSPVAASDGPLSADGGSNVRTRTYYDADGSQVATLPARAFTSSVQSPDYHFLVANDLDPDGRPVASYEPRSTTGQANPTGDAAQARDCTTGNRPAPVLSASSQPVPGYPSDTLVCVTRTTYDAAGNVATLRMPTSNGNDNRYSAYTYTDDDLPSAESEPAPAVAGTVGVTSAPTGPRVTTTLRYDGDSRLTSTTDPLGHVTTDVYNLDGTVLGSTRPPTNGQAHTFAYAYDASGQAISAVNQMNQTSRVARYSDGLIQAVTDGGGNATTYAYDINGNVASVVRPDELAANPNSPLKDLYTFSADNLLVRKTTPISADGTRRRRTDYTLDPAGRTTTASSNLADGGDNVTSPTASVVATAYYPDDRVASETGRDGTSRIVNVYNGAGLPTSTTDGSGGGSTLTTAYYLDGSVMSVDDGAAATGGHTTWSSYDGAGQRTGRADAVDGGAVTATTYNLNDAELPSSMSSAVGATTMAYDASGRLLNEKDPNGSSTSRAYNDDDTLASTALQSSAGATVSGDAYTYDPLQRVSTQAPTVVPAAGALTGTTPGTADNRTYGYAYDPAGRLSGFSQTAGTATTTQPITNDPDGNRTAMGTVSATYNLDDTMAGTSDSSVPNSARTASYTQQGDLSSDGCTTYGYDAFDRTSTQTTTAGAGCSKPTGTASYAYDGWGRQRTHGASTSSGLTVPGATVSVHHDGTGAAVSSEQTQGLGATSYELSPSGDTKAVTAPSGATDTLTTDGRDNISTALGASGSVDCTARYDPYGNATNTLPAKGTPCSTGTADLDIGFGQERRDQTTGEYQLGSRTYDPGQDSYTTADGAGGAAGAGAGTTTVDPLTADSYAYVNGDPVNNSDPSGHAAAGVHDQCGGRCDHTSPETGDLYQLVNGGSCGVHLNCPDGYLQSQSAIGYTGKQSFIRQLYVTYGDEYNNVGWYDNILGVIAFEQDKNLFASPWWDAVNSGILDGIEGGYDLSQNGQLPDDTPKHYNPGSADWYTFLNLRQKYTKKYGTHNFLQSAVNGASIKLWGAAEEESTRYGTFDAQQQGYLHDTRDVGILYITVGYRDVARSGLAGLANDGISILYDTSIVGLFCKFGIGRLLGGCKDLNDIASTFHAIDPRQGLSTYLGASILWKVLSPGAGRHESSDDPLPYP